MPTNLDRMAALHYDEWVLRPEADNQTSRKRTFNIKFGRHVAFVHKSTPATLGKITRANSTPRYDLKTPAYPTVLAEPGATVALAGSP